MLSTILFEQNILPSLSHPRRYAPIRIIGFEKNVHICERLDERLVFCLLFLFFFYYFPNLIYLLMTSLDYGPMVRIRLIWFDCDGSENIFFFGLHRAICYTPNHSNKPNKLLWFEQIKIRFCFHLLNLFILPISLLLPPPTVILSLYHLYLPSASYEMNKKDKSRCWICKRVVFGISKLHRFTLSNQDGIGWKFALKKGYWHTMRKLELWICERIASSCRRKTKKNNDEDYSNCTGW